MDMTTLQQNLVNAKKVMNKVDGGNFPKNEMPMTGNQPNINMESVQQHLPPTPLTSIPSAELPTSKPSLTPKANITENQIKNSKLPDITKIALKKFLINKNFVEIESSFEALKIIIGAIQSSKINKEIKIRNINKNLKYEFA